MNAQKIAETINALLKDFPEANIQQLAVGLGASQCWSTGHYREWSVRIGDELTVVTITRP